MVVVVVIIFPLNIIFYNSYTLWMIFLLLLFVLLWFRIVGVVLLLLLFSRLAKINFFQYFTPSNIIIKILLQLNFINWTLCWSTQSPWCSQIWRLVLLIHSKDSVATKQAIYSLAIMWDCSTLPKWVTEIPLSYCQSSHLPFFFCLTLCCYFKLGSDKPERWNWTWCSLL